MNTKLDELKVTIKPPEIIISPFERRIFSYDPNHNSFTISPDLIQSLDGKDINDLLRILVKMTVKVCR